MGLTKKIIKVSTTPTPLCYKKVGPDKYQLTQPVECIIEKWQRKKFKYTIQASFETNFRSGPKWLDDLGIPKIGNDKIATAWLIHDVNYAGYLSRKEADNLVYYMLLAGGLEHINCQLVFHGLRIFGGFNFVNKADDNVEVEVIYPGVDLEIFDPNEPILESMEQLPGESTISFDEQDFETVKKELEVLAAKQNKKIDPGEIRKFYKPK